MNRNDYISVVPRVKIWETKLLNKSYYDKLMDTSSFEEAVMSLQETIYGDGAKGVDLEKYLESSFRSMCSDLRGSLKNTMIVDFVCLKNDYHNIKTLIKSKVLNKDFSYMLNANGAVDVNKLSNAIKSEQYGDLSERIKNSITKTFETFEGSNDSQDIDITLDNCMFRHMVDISNDMENDFIKKYVKMVIDLTNIKTVLRLKKMNKDKAFLSKVYISGGSISLESCISMLADSFENIPNRLMRTDYEVVIKEGINDYSNTKSLGSLEKKIDNFIMKFVRDAKFVNFGVEPIFAYIYARETEMKNLRIILTGKLNNVDSKIINERLRDNYV